MLPDGYCIINSVGILSARARFPPQSRSRELCGFQTGRTKQTSVIHGKARAALLQALQPASPLGVNTAVTVSGETRNGELPQDSSLLNALV
jgi:hypothetical protein